MSESLPLVLSSIILIIILLILHLIIRYYQIKEGSFFEKISIIIYDYSIWTVLPFIIAGFAIIGGINFIFLLDFEQPFPQNLIIQGTDVVMFIIGGALVIVVSVYSIFYDLIYDKNSVVIGKSRVSSKILKFYRDHTRYKMKTDNPPMRIRKFLKIQKVETIVVETPNGTDFLTNNLHFNIFYEEQIPFPDSSSPMSSLEIAECVLYRRGEKLAEFKILKWFINDSNRETIGLLRANQNLGILKPFIRLKDHPKAEKFSYSELENLTKTLSKLKISIEEK
jgi:hypothetical protein